MPAPRKNRARGAFLACFLLSAAPLGAADKAVTLTVPQARIVAGNALKNGNPAMAIELGKSLLKADPRDPYAYVVIARGYEILNNPRLARRAAGYAFRYSDTSETRFAAAQLAARLAYREKRYTLAQYWLRRSLDPAPNAQLRAQAISDFRRVRAQNPWSFRLSFSAAPSDNVNSGTANPDLEVDGRSTGWNNSISAQRLAGTTLVAGITGAYRLAGSSTAQTRLDFRLERKQIILSSAAQTALETSPNPAERGLTGADFSSTFAEIGITHQFASGPAGRDGRKRDAGAVSLSFGGNWYGGKEYYRFAEATLSRSFSLGTSQQLSLSGGLEYRRFASGDPARIAQLRATYSTAPRDRVEFVTGLILTHTESARLNTESDSAIAFLSFAPAEKVGPAKLRFILGASLLDYPRYVLPLSAAGRRDRGAFATVDMQFDSLGYAGFSPNIALTTRHNSSNISRFDTDELTLSIGFRSNF